MEAMFEVLSFVAWNVDDLRKHDPLVTFHKPAPARLRRPPSVHVDRDGFRVFRTDGVSLADFTESWTARAAEQIPTVDHSWLRRLDLAGVGS